MITIKQLFEPNSSTYTYLLFDQQLRQAVIIDPVDTEVKIYLQELEGSTLKLILDTHLHADHVTAAAVLKEKTDAHYGLNAALEGVDLPLQDGQIITIGSIKIKVISTPGHTVESVCFLVDSLLFTGDTLLIGKCGRTDFQGGSAAALYNSVTQKIFTLPDDIMVYPGHEYDGRTHSTLGWEKKNNSRLAHKTKEEFIAIMDNLNLPYPKTMGVAVPANMKCGRRLK